MSWRTSWATDTKGCALPNAGTRLCGFGLKSSLRWHGRSLFVCLPTPACAMQCAAIDRLLLAVRDLHGVRSFSAPLLPSLLLPPLLCMQDAGFVFGYDEPLSHMIYAAADIILVPSMFEPCGLTQMIGMRCGGFCRGFAMRSGSWVYDEWSWFEGDRVGEGVVSAVVGGTSPTSANKGTHSVHRFRTAAA